MSATLSSTIHTLNVNQEERIDAPIEIAFESLLAVLGPEGQMPDGKAFPRTLEPWPGGRWFRDLGNNTGHLWGHVQVIKPPTLLEICGPLFMSYPAASHLQYRLTPDGSGTKLTLLHRAFGEIPSEHSEGVKKGWASMFVGVRAVAKRLMEKRGGKR